MLNRKEWIVLSVLMVLVFGVYTVDPATYEDVLGMANDLSKVEILTDESDGQGDKMYLDPIKADGRTPEQIAKDLFFEGKRLEYERYLDRPISDMEFQVMYEKEYKEEQQRRARASGPLTGPALASRKLFCGDDALCMQTGIQ